MHQTTELLGFLVGTLILCRLPVVGKTIRILNTLVHESSHALMALFTSGEVVSVNLYQDTSGDATTRPGNKFSSFLISIAGYTGSSIMALICLYLIFHTRYNWIFYLILSLCLLNLVFWVRNTYGLLWLIFTTSLCIALVYYKQQLWIRWLSLSFTGIIFWDSIISALIIFILSVKSPKAAGDASSLKKITHLPAFFWGLLFLFQALFLAWIGIKLFIPVTE